MKCLTALAVESYHLFPKQVTSPDCPHNYGHENRGKAVSFFLLDSKITSNAYKGQNFQRPELTKSPSV